MQIHELNTFSGTPGETDYLPIDTGFDTAKISAPDLLQPIKDQADKIDRDKVNIPKDENNQPDNGAAGQLLRTNGDGSTEWVDEGQPTDAQTAQAVSDWLDAHPEATTTVQDGSLTEAKFDNSLKLKTIKDYVTPQMFGAVGDGVADDTQAVKDMLTSGVDIIIIPEGTYLITDTLIIPTGKDITCVGLLLFSGVSEAVIFGDTSINKFCVRSLNISADAYDDSTIGFKILDCIESTFENLFSNQFGTNILVTAINGATSYNTFINPKATRGKYNFKVLGIASAHHCNENYIFGGRLFSDSNTVRQLSIEGYANDWSVVNISAEGTGECAVYCNTQHCSFFQIRTEGTWTEAGVFLDSSSVRCRVYSTRYDATLKDSGQENTYITNRIGAKFYTGTAGQSALTAACKLGSGYKAFSVFGGSNEYFSINGAGAAEAHVFRITQSARAFSPFKIGNYTFWIKDGYFYKKEGTPSDDYDGVPVGREYRAFGQSPVNVLAPKFVGDEVLDTAHNIWYKAVGTTIADWVALNS